MPTVHFTSNLRRHVDAPSCEVGGRTVAESLNEVFAEHARLRGYVLDEGGALRKHMNVFVDGEPIGDRTRLSDSIRADSEIYVMQALSGG